MGEKLYPRGKIALYFFIPVFRKKELGGYIP